MKTPQAVQTFGRKKKATAVAHVKKGTGNVKLNGVPITLFEPKTLKVKVQEPLVLLGEERTAGMDIKITVKGGGRTAQAYALRQAIAKGILAYTAKYVDEASKNEIKDMFVSYDRSLVVADPRRTEPKKFGGHGARARAQKSYR